MPELIDLLFYALLTALVLAILVLLWARGRPRVEIDPPTLSTAMSASLAQSADVLKGAVSMSLREMRLGEDLGAIKSSANSMLSVAQDLQSLFVRKGERSAWGEMQLEEILRDAFPAGKIGIREDLVGIGRPDAHLKLADGVLCVDTKFPLENYRAMAASTDARESKQLAAAFRSDVRSHLEKIAADYVRPERGTLSVAYAYIPSEAVYVHLVEQEAELLREFGAKGVVVAGPSTLLASLNLVHQAERAREISERAEEIEANLKGLRDRFDAFENEWTTLMRHFRNANAKMEGADRAYGNLRSQFDTVARLERGSEGSPEGPAEEDE